MLGGGGAPDLDRTLQARLPEFGLAGAVQHGASTLPMDYFGKFPESGTVEIHLALGFNNLIFDHPKLPQAVKDEIRAYCFTHHANERKPEQTEAQFIYTTRKKAWAGMKQRFWDLPDDVQETLMGSLEEMFRDMFTRMNVGGTDSLVARFTQAPVVALYMSGVKNYNRNHWVGYWGLCYGSHYAPLIGTGPHEHFDWADLIVIGTEKQKPLELFEYFTKKSPVAWKFADAKVETMHSCTTKAFAPMKTPYRGNCLMIGDAAAFVEVQAQGALNCGFWAADAVAKEIDGKPGFAEYGKTWLETFEFNDDGMMQVTTGYALIPYYTDEEVVYLFSLMDDIVLNAATASSGSNYTALWWNAAESGWGVNVTHQNNTIFATLFTYDASGKGLWLVMSAGTRQGDGSYQGDLFQTAGPAFNTVPF
ncbi:MAG: hypothetical protein HGA82_03190, partial [Anaerolineales bacterium]|nr:hypothetical protein [Anaerolineales bacterium]